MYATGWSTVFWTLRALNNLLLECVCVSHSVMFNSATLWTVPRQAPLSMGLPRQEYWSGLPFPSARDLPNTGLDPRSPALQVASLPSEPPRKSLVKLNTPNWNSELIFSSVQSLSCVQLFATSWTTAYQFSLTITNSQGLLKLMSIA